MKTLLLTLFFICSSALAQTPFSLLFPLACKLNTNCYIQNYVDDDPSDNAMDFEGRHLTYNKHKGTDIAVARYSQMDHNIAVYAAAPGTIKRLRDGVADNRSRDFYAPPGKECGNGILIDHGHGWETIYCHLHKGSIIVKIGQHVKAGQQIADMGASGKAAFPHLHVGVIKNGVIVDPFVEGLWRPNITYKPFGMIDMGLTNARVALPDVLDKPRTQNQFTPKDKFIVAWFRIYGTNKGDEQRISFYTPKGRIYKSPIGQKIPGNYVQWFTMAGFKTHKNLPKGTWQVNYQIKHQDSWQTLATETFHVTD